MTQKEVQTSLRKLTYVPGQIGISERIPRIHAPKVVAAALTTTKKFTLLENDRKMLLQHSNEMISVIGLRPRGWDSRPLHCENSVTSKRLSQSLQRDLTQA